MKYKINPCGIVYEVIEFKSNKVVGVFETKTKATQYKKSLESEASGFEGDVPDFFTNSIRKWV